MGRRYMAIPAVVNTPICSLCSECTYIYLGIGACDVYDQTRRRVSDQAGFKQSLYEMQPLNFVSHHSSGRGWTFSDPSDTKCKTRGEWRRERSKDESGGGGVRYCRKGKDDVMQCQL